MIKLYDDCISLVSVEQPCHKSGDLFQTWDKKCEHNLSTAR